MLSLGNARGFSSFAGMSPDELLATGELDEMLKAVSVARECRRWCHDVDGSQWLSVALIVPSIELVLK